MSGICGLIFSHENKNLKQADLLPMVQALDVSGQREAFTTCLGPVGIGAQGFPGRLTGLAEMTYHGRTLALAFHGSVYNQKELFPLAGQDFDQVNGVLHLYLKEGLACLQRLCGDFVLSLWDGREETLYLVTDRFRVYPLFYYQDQDKLVFASRMKGILASPFPVKRTINLEAVVDVVASSIIPSPKTIFREVQKLPPGYVLAYRKGEIKLKPYWNINFLHSDQAGEAELAQKLKTSFRDAVSIRLQADGVSDRIGTFLSGGVDSSMVTGVLTQLAKRPIKSFSIGFDEERFNEINYARIAARSFGSEHNEYFVTPQDTCHAIPILVDAFDEPFGNASAVAVYFCAKMAREHGVQFLYAGDGGDELFAGNERYATQYIFEYYRKIPSWLRESLLTQLIPALADRLRWDLLVKAKKYIRRATTPYPERLSSYGFFHVVPISELLEADLLHAIEMDYNPDAPVSFHYFQAPARSELDRQLYIDLKLAISDNDLLKVIRPTEAVGVALRFPFLDHRLAEFAATVPASIKMQGRKLRSFFKKAYADFLPQEILTKKKHGFGLPIPVWLRTHPPLNDMMHDLILGQTSTSRHYFKRKMLEEIIGRHANDGTSFYGTALWNLMSLELWLRQTKTWNNHVNRDGRVTEDFSN